VDASFGGFGVALLHGQDRCAGAVAVEDQTRNQDHPGAPVPAAEPHPDVFAQFSLEASPWPVFAEGPSGERQRRFGNVAARLRGGDQPLIDQTERSLQIRFGLPTARPVEKPVGQNPRGGPRDPGRPAELRTGALPR